MYINDRDKSIEFYSKKFPKSELISINLLHKSAKLKRLMDLGTDCGVPELNNHDGWDKIYSAINNGYNIDVYGDWYEIPLGDLKCKGEVQYLTYDSTNSTYYASVKTLGLIQVFSGRMLKDVPEKFRNLAVLV